MIVVADTTPINYLVLIGQIDILSALYGQIVIPAAVRDELLSEHTPLVVRNWATNPPAWVEVRTPHSIVDPRWTLWTPESATQLPWPKNSHLIN